MALLVIKKMLFSSASSINTPSYTLLPSFAHQSNSRDASLDSDRSSEKQAVPTRAGSSSFRVDPRIISDATIGLSDGLTVPFALTAGLSALGSTKLVIYGGLAELIAGGISMGLGGYLGALSEAQGYQAALSRTRKMLSEDPETAKETIKSTFDSYGFSDHVVEEIAASLLASKEKTEDFLMRFHHQLPESASSASRPYAAGVTIAVGYLCGGLIPLTPYFLAETNQIAFYWSVTVMAMALFLFGFVKTLLVGEGKKLQCVKGGVQMMVLGGVAAAAAMGCVKAVGSE